MAQPGKQPKTAAQTRAELLAEVSNLGRACESWEFGHFEQSTTIAGHLRTLLHDLGSNVSLLRQSGMKHKDFFYTPSWFLDHNGLLQAQLAWFEPDAYIPVEGEMKANVAWRPVYHRSLQTNPLSDDFRSDWTGMSFDGWWAQAVLHGEGHSFTREALVKTLANRLGGSHSDPTIPMEDQNLLDEKYGYGFSTGKLHSSRGSASAKNTAYQAAVRQIAYEVQRTLCHHYAETFPPETVVPPLPDDGKWAGLEGHGIRISRNYDQKLRDQLLAQDGQWCGMLETMRTEDYWRSYREQQLARGGY